MSVKWAAAAGAGLPSVERGAPVAECITATVPTVTMAATRTVLERRPRS
jgi:hypothetical protein